MLFLQVEETFLNGQLQLLPELDKIDTVVVLHLSEVVPESHVCFYPKHEVTLSHLGQACISLILVGIGFLGFVVRLSDGTASQPLLVAHPETVIATPTEFDDVVELVRTQ